MCGEAATDMKIVWVSLLEDKCRFKFAVSLVSSKEINPTTIGKIVQEDIYMDFLQLKHNVGE